MCTHIQKGAGEEDLRSPIMMPPQDPQKWSIEIHQTDTL